MAVILSFPESAQHRREMLLTRGYAIRSGDAFRSWKACSASVHPAHLETSAPLLKRLSPTARPRIGANNEHRPSGAQGGEVFSLVATPFRFFTGQAVRRQS